MRRLLWALALIAAGWSGWWSLAGTGFRGGITTWMDARVAEGWQAEAAEIAGGGYPLSVQALFRDLAVADPETGLALQTATLNISAPAWWPGDVTVALDDGPIGVATPLGRYDLRMTDGVMALQLHPGTALELEAMRWTAGPWSVRDRDAGALMQADTLQLTLTQTEGPTYAYLAEAQAFTPGDTARDSLRLPVGLERSFDSLTLSGQITFDRPWDRSALDQSRPQPRRIDVERAEAHWGEMRLNFAAALDVDTSGRADGSIAVRAENWQTILNLAQNTGQLRPGVKDQLERVLGALAGASGNPETLDARLTLRGGVVFLGFVPLGDAPPLRLR